VQKSAEKTVPEIPGLNLVLSHFGFIYDGFMHIPETDSSGSSAQSPAPGRLNLLF